MAFLNGGTGIIGVGASRFERRPDASVLEFAGAAIDGALADARLEKDQIDGLIVQIGSPRGSDYDTVAHSFGLDPQFCGQSWSHGRFAASILMHAAMAVSAGLASRVLCLMAMKNSDIGRMGEANNPFYYEQFRENGGPHAEEGHIGMTSPVAGAAMAFDLYCRRYAVEPELLAAIPLAFRRHARLTNDAVMTGEMTEADYFNSKPIIDPLRLYDCSPVGDGAVAMIVAKADNVSRSVRITGAQGMRAGRDTFIFAPVGLGMAQQTRRRLTRAETLAQPVYTQAAVQPGDMDLLGLYDSFSPLPLYALEDFGFCEEGQALHWIQGGRIEHGGDCPINTAGGQLSQAQMNGWGQLRELVTQLRGEAGDRQIPYAKRAMWASVGGDALVLEAS